eukprot:Tbor_TRINITY_DN5237_c0_g1::TRINITY_DN5237_c0_g1_i1::g.16202::m.16202
MPQKRLTKLKFLPNLPVDTEPTYADGYECDFCNNSFSVGPFYHCALTGIDACIKCATTKKCTIAEDQLIQQSNGGSNGNMNTISAMDTSTSHFGNSNNMYTLVIHKIAFPTLSLIRETSESLQRLTCEQFAGVEGAEDLVTALKDAKVLFAYMIQSNVVCVLLSTGANILAIYDNSMLAAAWVTISGKSTTQRALDGAKSAFNLEQTGQSILKQYNWSNHQDIANPIYPVHFQRMFPWVERLRSILLVDAFKPISSGHMMCGPYVQSEAMLPYFISSCSTCLEYHQKIKESVVNAVPQGTYFGATLSSNMFQIISFVNNLEIHLQFNGEQTRSNSVCRAWSKRGPMLDPLSVKTQSLREWGIQLLESLLELRNG